MLIDSLAQMSQPARFHYFSEGRLQNGSNRPRLRHDARRHPTIRRDAQGSTRTLPTEILQAGAVTLRRSTAKLTDAIGTNVLDAFASQERNGVLNVVFVDGHADDAGAQREPRRQHGIDMTHGSVEAADLLGYLVMNLGAVGIHRRRDVNRVLDKTVEQL